jgi:hypothetical protein
MDDSSNDDDDDISDRFKELLADDRSSTSRSNKHNRHRNKYSRKRDHRGYSSSPRHTPPTLAQLEAQGGYRVKKELRDINNVTVDEHEEEDLKREIMFKIDILRKSYPHVHIQDYSIHSDLHSMKQDYEVNVRNLSLDDSVTKYKEYLLMGFMGCEYLLARFLGFDMDGFAAQQALSMNRYEKLLIELGAKSYVPGGDSKWPVEIRLLGLVIVNAAIFIATKMFANKTGADIMSMLNSLGGNNSNSAPLKRKRKMKGPDINMEDIPDLEK